ncbi:MAG: hypothetical protein H6Q13_180 [Bacteroidetes bacterium]|nr:hypothetical protein [Bacteroidota bacterium]
MGSLRDVLRNIVVFLVFFFIYAFKDNWFNIKDYFFGNQVSNQTPSMRSEDIMERAKNDPNSKVYSSIQEAVTELQAERLDAIGTFGFYYNDYEREWHEVSLTLVPICTEKGLYRIEVAEYNFDSRGDSENKPCRQNAFPVEDRSGRFKYGVIIDDTTIYFNYN